jgi:hypothetical protein
MFGSEPTYTKNTRCGCGRDPQETAVTSFRSISGTYLFHRCPCGIEWTEHVAAPELPSSTHGPAVREFHEHVHAFHGAMREAPRPHASRRTAARAHRGVATR